VSAPRAPPVAPTAPAAPVPRARYRRGRVSDTRQLIDLYMGLSAEARHGFHPFPFRRSSLWVLYPSVLAASRLLRPLMRRFPRLIVVVVVAELEGQDGIVAYGTLRGEVPANGSPQVRFGFVVGNGFRGYHIGPGLLRRLAEEGYALGMRRGVGMVFRRDARAIKAIKALGWEFRESARRDPKAPEEENYETSLDLEAAVRTPPAGTTVAAGPGNGPSTA